MAEALIGGLPDAAWLKEHIYNNGTTFESLLKEQRESKLEIGSIPTSDYQD